MLCDHNVYCDWDGAGLIAVNTTAGAKPDDIITALRSAQIAHQEDAPHEPLVMGKHILMYLRDWQILMGIDQASATTAINNMHWQIIHAGPGPWLTFKIGSYGKLACPAIPRVDCDFYGNLMPAEHLAPGPFQAVGYAGSYLFRL
jgi:hypothetical protein